VQPLKLVPADPNSPRESEVETVVLSTAQLEYLDGQGRRMNPEMPAAFSRAHVLRTLLERLEESELDLTDLRRG
jgi:hypothetical protein